MALLRLAFVVAGLVLLLVGLLQETSAGAVYYFTIESGKKPSPVSASDPLF